MSQNDPNTAQGVRLEVRSVDKRYGTRDVLKKTELTIEPGQFVAIVGRSGCGKSTLLRLVAGLESVSGGAIRLDGQDITGLSGDTRIMFQDSRLLPWKRVADNVALGLPPERRGAAADVLARVGLGDRLDHVQGTDGFPHKPAPDVSTHALAGVGRPGSWMIGDTDFDIEAGRAAGLRTCAVTWGVHDDARLRRAAPDAIVDTVDQLHALLLA